jgi:hypothetical protein
MGKNRQGKKKPKWWIQRKHIYLHT